MQLITFRGTHNRVKFMMQRLSIKRQHIQLLLISFNLLVSLNRADENASADFEEAFFKRRVLMQEGAFLNIDVQIGARHWVHRNLQVSG
jgi:hypothetical protein